MVTLGKTIIVLVCLACLSGCAIHFKGTDVELDAEPKRVEMNKTYELESVNLFHG